MPTVIVDGKEVQIEPHERLNGIQAAARLGIEIPHYCWHAGLTVVASCRMCLVETGRRDPQTGQVSMMPKLVPACQTPATDGTIFLTNSPKVQEARAMVEEDLLLRHPVDCPICDKAGECRLQDYHFQYGRDQRRADIKPFTSRRRPLGDTVTLFVDRCVMCTRCVRFCREVAGTSELMVANRGAHEEIDVFPGFPLANKLSGNVVDLCPVGALGDKDFLYRQRVWFMKSHDGVCGSCSTGCSISAEENQDHIYRVKPRENPFVNQWWMCDEGRYGWKHVHDERRLVGVQRRDHARTTNLEWPEAVREISARLRAADHLAAVLSPFLTVEDAYLCVKYIRSLDPKALIAVGPIPTEGEDERFPQGFTIHAEKCPNRRGVEKVAGHFQGALVSWAECREQLASGQIGGLWLAGGYPQAWWDDATVDAITQVPVRVIQDLFPSPITETAHFILPAAAYPEREGSFVNASDRLQSFSWAIRAPAGVQSEGRLFWQLLENPGLYQPRAVLDEVAREIGYFAPAAEPIPDVGLDLKINLLAASV